MTQRDTRETMEWLRGQHASGTRAWGSKCLQLQRTARNLPAVYPSALAAAHATPEADRVYDVNQLRRGMVVYFDDPHDGNPYAHVTSVAGRTRRDRSIILEWTNDAKNYGAVDLVRHTFFPAYWGDKFMFGATSLNGFDLILPDRTPGPLAQGDRNFDRAIDALEDAIADHSKKRHDALVRALKRELADMREIRKRFD